MLMFCAKIMILYTILICFSVLAISQKDSYVYFQNCFLKYFQLKPKILIFAWW